MDCCQIPVLGQCLQFQATVEPDKGVRNAEEPLGQQPDFFWSDKNQEALSLLFILHIQPEIVWEIS